MYIMRIRTDSIIYEVKTIRLLLFPPAGPSPRDNDLVCVTVRRCELVYGWTLAGLA